MSDCDFCEHCKFYPEENQWECYVYGFFPGNCGCYKQTKQTPDENKRVSDEEKVTE